MQEDRAAPAADGPVAILVFDGDCSLCSDSVAFVRRHDEAQRIRPVASGSPEGRRLLQRRGLVERAGDTLLWFGRDIEGKAHEESAAVVRILWRLGRFWRVPAVLYWLVPRPVRDGAYRWVARRRHRLRRASRA